MVLRSHLAVPWLKDKSPRWIIDYLIARYEQSLASLDAAQLMPRCVFKTFAPSELALMDKTARVRVIAETLDRRLTRQASRFVSQWPTVDHWRTSGH